MQTNDNHCVYLVTTRLTESSPVGVYWVPDSVESVRKTNWGVKGLVVSMDSLHHLMVGEWTMWRGEPLFRILVLVSTIQLFNITSTLFSTFEELLPTIEDVPNSLARLNLDLPRPDLKVPYGLATAFIRWRPFFECVGHAIQVDRDADFEQKFATIAEPKAACYRLLSPMDARGYSSSSQKTGDTCPSGHCPLWLPDVPKNSWALGQCKASR